MINKNKQGKVAVMQIVVLVIAIFAFAWMVGAIEEGDDGTTTGGTESCTYCRGDSLYSGVKSEGGQCTLGVKIQDCPNGCFDGQCLPSPNDGGTSPYTEFLKDTGTSFGTGYITNQVEKYLEKNSPKIIKPKNIFSKVLRPSSTFGQIAVNAGLAAATATIIIFISKTYASERNLNDITTFTLIGAGAGVSIATIAVLAGAGPPGWIASAVTGVFYGAYMLFGYQTYSRETFTFYPRLWQPSDGGSECDKCNNLEYPNGENACSEYICHSYGQACEWINNETKYETCVEKNSGDERAPEITAIDTAYNQSIFPDDDYEYEFSDAGAGIVYTGEGGDCVPAFSQIILAVGTDEEAYCKVSLERYTGFDYETRFEQMTDLQEGNVNTKEHTLILPRSVTASESALAEAGYALNNGGNFEFYVRCKDIQGNINENDYILAFCVQEELNTWAPEVTGTDPEQDSYVKEGTLTIPNFKVYMSEPADCKWDFERKSYNAMEYEFDKCSQSLNDPIRGVYDLGCVGNLTGFEDRIVNKYYISCLDQPELKGTEDESKRNEMDPYELRLIGTNTLEIQDIKVNDENNETIIRDSRNRINVELKVRTSGGAEDGKSRCRYSSDGISYSLFGNKGSRDFILTNTHNLYLEEGNYTYYVQCEDAAANVATSSINFEIETDITPPEVVRWFKNDDYLTIVTNEDAKCVYSVSSDLECIYSFDDDGIPFVSEAGTYGRVHYTDWPENSQTTYYIKCEDQYGKIPASGDCSTIVRPFKIPELK